MRPQRGDDGYREHCTVLIEQGRCACEGCLGMLTDPALSAGGWSFCRACGCAHKVQVIDRHRYAAWVPAYGRCGVADARLAEERRLQDQQARRWLVAGEGGDPQR